MISSAVQINLLQSDSHITCSPAAIITDVMDFLLTFHWLFHQCQKLYVLPEWRRQRRFTFTDVYVQVLTNTEMRLFKNQEQLHSSVALSLAYIPDLETQPSAYT